MFRPRGDCHRHGDGFVNDTRVALMQTCFSMSEFHPIEVYPFYVPGRQAHHAVDQMVSKTAAIMP